MCAGAAGADIADRRDDLCIDPSAAVVSAGGLVIHHLTQTKQGISSIELGRRLGVNGRPPPGRSVVGWRQLAVMLERDATKRLSGRIEIDDAYLGGEPPLAGAARPRRSRRSAVRRRRRGRPPKEGQFGSSYAESPASVQPRLPGSPTAAWIRTALSSATAFSVSPASPMPGARIRSSRPGQGLKAARTPAFKWVNNRTWQHQGRHHRNLPRHQQQACPALPRRIRTPVCSDDMTRAGIDPTEPLGPPFEPH